MILSNNDLLKNYDDCKNYFYQNPLNSDQKSKHWSYYFNSKKINEDDLKNFRLKHKLSHGLDDQDVSFGFKIFSKIIEEISEDYVLNNLSKKNVGNSDALIDYKGYFVDYGKLNHIHWFHTVEEEILKKNNIESVCEIGGGFGSFSELFIKNYNIKLISIDLPEANLMSSYYLKETFPGKKIYLFKDYIKSEMVTLDDFNNSDIIILPPNCKFDEKIKIDFFINTRSMMEMRKSSIKSYFNFIQSKSHQNSYFLNINRYEKNSSGDMIRFFEYPYDDKWVVIFSKPSFNQEWIHFLITKRCEDKSKANISVVLKDIEHIGKKYYGLHKDYVPSFVKTKKTIKQLLKTIFGKKILHFFGNFFLKLGRRLKDIK